MSFVILSLSQRSPTRPRNWWTSDNKIGKCARGREFNLVMLWFLTAKASTRLFDDPAIEAQATWGKQMMRVNQVGMQTHERTIGSSRGQERTQIQPAFEHANPLGEADPIRIQSLGLGCLQQKSTDGIMGQQECVELLQDQDGQFTAQGLAAQTLVILDLIDGQFDFPPLMIEHTEITGYIEIRIEQGCGYSMDLANIRIGRETATADARGRNLFQTSCYLLFNPILDDAQGQRFLQAGILSGQKSDQITAIFEDVLLVFKHMLGDTAQEASSMSDKLLQKAHPDKATIGHDKHPRLNRAQQPLGQTVFRSGAGSNHGSNNGLSSYLYQIDAMQLRNRSLRRACTVPTKLVLIGMVFMNIFIHTLDC